MPARLRSEPGKNSLQFCADLLATPVYAPFFRSARPVQVNALRPAPGVRRSTPAGRRRRRAPVIDELVAQRLKSVIAEVVAEKQACIVGIKVTADHVHLLVEVPPQLGVHRLVKAVKARSARVLGDEFPSLRSRLPSLWTNTYLVNTVGNLIAPATVQDFIDQQPGR